MSHPVRNAPPRDAGDGTRILERPRPRTRSFDAAPSTAATITPAAGPSDTGRSPRSWSGSALCVGALALAIHLATAGTGDASRAWEAASLALAVAAAAVACGIAASRPTPLKVTWLRLAAAIAAYGSTRVAYGLSPGAASAFPSVFDLGLVLFYPLMLLAVADVVRRRVIGFAGVLWLDCALGALTFSALGALVVATDLRGGLTVAAAGQLTYLVGDLGLLGFLVTALALGGWRAGWSLMGLAAGVGLMAVCDGIWALEVAGGAGTVTPLQATGWVVALLLLAGATLRPVPRVALSSAGWARVGVGAAAATVSLPLVVVSQPGTLHSALAGMTLMLVVIRFTVSLRSAFQLSNTDALTGLANRRLLVERVGEALARRSRDGGTIAVMIVDLDDFKEINDRHGHAVGDHVLVAAGVRLKTAFRARDTSRRGDATSDGRRPRTPRETVFRVSGNEFAVLVEQLRGPSDVTVLGERVLGAFRLPLVAGGMQVPVSASVGISVAAGEAVDPAVVLRDADTAMHAAKRAGKGGFLLFDEGMEHEIVMRTTLSSDLRTAVARGQMRLLYQPQVDVASTRIVGVEALVRWEHPELGLLTPDRFIPLAERTGLIRAIDDWVLREASSQLCRWDADDLPALRMAVNVSAGRLVTGSFVASIAATLRETNLAAERLEVEITETVAVDYEGVAAATLESVRDLGVRVAIDDFGTGYSALSRLAGFPADRLKIDRCFVSTLTKDEAHGSLVGAMIAIGESLDLEVVAEGVETQAHLDALRVLGCPTAQGYLFSKPVSADAIAALARAGRPLSPGADEPRAADELRPTPSADDQERMTRVLLAELQRLTGLESTYLTRIDQQNAVQHVTHARNTGTIDIPEGLSVDWSQTVCRRALEQGVTYTDDARVSFPGCDAVEDLGLQTYISVPLLDRSGGVQGTLCGASSKQLTFGPAAVQVLRRFGEVIAEASRLAEPRAEAGGG